MSTPSVPPSSTQSEVIAWVNLGLSAIPGIVSIVKLVQEILIKHPDLTLETLMAALTSLATQSNADVAAAYKEWAEEDATKVKA